jgi:hypothetical protein
MGYVASSRTTSRTALLKLRIGIWAAREGWRTRSIRLITVDCAWRVQLFFQSHTFGSNLLLKNYPYHLVPTRRGSLVFDQIAIRANRARGRARANHESPARRPSSTTTMLLRVTSHGQCGVHNARALEPRGARFPSDQVSQTSSSLCIPVIERPDTPSA